MSQRTVVEVIKQQETQKMQTQRRQRRPLLCVDASAFDAAFSPFFFRCHGNLEKRSRVNPNLT